MKKQLKNKKQATKKSKDNTKIIKELTAKLLLLLKEKKAEIKIHEKEGLFEINIDTDNNGVLIGNHGQTIFSLQLILSLMIYKKIGIWQKILINVGDYREQREESLKKLAINNAQKVRFSGNEVVLMNLNPAERRIIHLELANMSDIKTESQGEGQDRKLIIKLKKK